MSSVTEKSSRIERFGPYRFDLERSTLYRGDEPVILARKRFEVLLLLAEQAGHIVRKEDIISRVWQGQHVEESNLTLQIFNLRRDIEEDPKKPVYILTAPGLGYMLRTDRVELEPPVISSVPSAGGPEMVGARRPESRRRLALVMITIVAFCLATSLLIGYHRWPATSSANLRITPYTSLSGLESDPSFSPDGRMLVFSSEGELGANRDLYLKRGEDDQPVRLTDHRDNDGQACWSPDGRQIAFIRRDETTTPAKARLIVLDSLERRDGKPQEREVAEVNGGLDWSPDGRYFVISDTVEGNNGSGLSLLAIDGSEKIVITTPPRGEVVRDTNPRFSPDGKKVAFLRNHDGVTALTDLFLAELDKKGGAAPRQLTFDRRRIGDLQWMPDGQSIIIASDRDNQRRLWQVPITPGPPRIVPSIEGKVQTFALTRDGERLAYTERLQDTTIEIRRLGTTEATSTSYPCQINSSSTEDSPRFSPDGTRLAFISGRTGRKELWIARTDCTGETMQTTFPNLSGPGSPRWSPDGGKIAFDRDERLVNVHLLDLTASAGSTGALPRSLEINNHSNILPAWSHDGRTIYFESSRDGGPQIWGQNIETGQQFRLTNGGGSEPIENLDGTYLFYTKKGRIWRRNQQTGAEEMIRELESFTIGRYWDLGTRSIYFVPRTKDIRPAIYRFDLLTRRIEKVMELGGFATRTIPGLSVTRDEKLLAVSYVSYSLGDIKVAVGWQ
jgi:Tol biopolymer transport system component/DNA-binding winged helix-turn-helix (wHTH) protein